MSSFALENLRPLTDDELARVAGGGGDLDISFTAPPLRGGVGLTYKDPFGSVTGNLSTDGTTWKAGIGGELRLGRVGVEGSFRSDLKSWEVQAKVRIAL